MTVESRALPVGSYVLAAPAASCRRLVNCFVQEAPPERPRGDPALLVRAPGIVPFAEVAEDEVRGFCVMGDVLYGCASETLYKILADGTATALSGTAITGSGPVRMQTNGTSIVVTPGNGDGFSSDGSTTVQITDPDFTVAGGAADVAFLDGYLAFRRPGTPSFINSGINDLTFAGLDIASANGKPGNLVGLIANNRELILAKADSTENWYNAANPVGSPFARSPDGFKELGCAASLSLCTQDNSPVMLASDGTFRRLQNVWTRISQYGIETVLAKIANKSDCLALPYTLHGHLFVVFTFANGGRTLVVDMTTGEWHERFSMIGSVSVNSWRVQAICSAYGRTIVGDRLSGKIGYLDHDTFDEWGEPQVVQWTYPAIYAAGLKASHRRLEIGLTSGYGTATGQGADPKLTLFVSDDGGNTFRARPSKSLGVMGAYRTRIVYDNLGESGNRVYRCQMSDPVRLLALDTQLDVEGARK